jgi:hypothetical protein
MTMLKLKETPDLHEETTWEAGAVGDRTTDFVIWPAEDEGNEIRIRISAKELADFAGGSLPVDGSDAKLALNRCRSAIEHCAAEKRLHGEMAITIDSGDLSAMPQTWRL